jgi:hypothetical protein
MRNVRARIPVPCSPLPVKRLSLARYFVSLHHPKIVVEKKKKLEVELEMKYCAPRRRRAAHPHYVVLRFVANAGEMHRIVARS